MTPSLFCSSPVALIGESIEPTTRAFEIANGCFQPCSRGMTGSHPMIRRAIVMSGWRCPRSLREVDQNQFGTEPVNFMTMSASWRMVNSPVFQFMAPSLHHRFHQADECLHYIIDVSKRSGSASHCHRWWLANFSKPERWSLKRPYRRWVHPRT